MDAARIKSVVSKIVGIDSLSEHMALRERAEKLQEDHDALFSFLVEVEEERVATARRLAEAMGTIDALQEIIRQLDEQLEEYAPAIQQHTPGVPAYMEEAYTEAKAKLTSANYADVPGALAEIMRLIEAHLPMDAAVRRDMLLHLADVWLDPVGSGSLMSASAHLNQWGKPVWKATHTPRKYRVIYTFEGAAITVIDIALRKEIYSQRGRT
jgi:hypothetical protein